MASRPTLSSMNQSASSRVSIGRPSIGMSDFKQSGRMSLSMGRRNSSIGIPRPSVGISNNKDPRNFSDKAFTNNGIRILINYLTEHNYNHPISPKLLTRPTNKDFNNIILFLFQQIDPQFVSNGKFEDDVIIMMKTLGYPFTINKSSLTSVGTHHSWPPLLGCLIWLVELLNYDEAVINGQMDDEREYDMEDPTSIDKYFHNYLTKAYTLVMSQEEEEFRYLEGQFHESFENKNLETSQRIQELQAENQRIIEEIQRAETMQSSLPDLEEKKRVAQKNLAKFESLIESLEQTNQQMLTKTQARQTELDKATATWNSVKEEVLALKQRVEGQELSTEDVKNMQEEHVRLEEAQIAASENRQVLQRKVWDSETALRDRVEALDDAVRTYNTTLEDLKLSPETLHTLNIDVDIRAKKRNALVKTDVRGEVLPALQKLRLEFLEKTSHLGSELSRTQDGIEQSEQQTFEIQEEMSMLEGKCRRIEETYKREKEVHEQATSRLSSDVSEMESRLRELRETGQEEVRVEAAQRKLAELKALREARRQEHSRSKKEMVGSILEVVTQCAGHRELVQQSLSELKSLYSSKLEGLLMGKQIKQQKQQQQTIQKQPLSTRTFQTKTLETEKGKGKGNFTVIVENKENQGPNFSQADLSAPSLPNLLPTTMKKGLSYQPQPQPQTQTQSLSQSFSQSLSRPQAQSKPQPQMDSSFVLPVDSTKSLPFGFQPQPTSRSLPSGPVPVQGGRGAVPFNLSGLIEACVNPNQQPSQTKPYPQPQHTSQSYQHPHSNSNLNTSFIPPSPGPLSSLVTSVPTPFHPTSSSVHPLPYSRPSQSQPFSFGQPNPNSNSMPFSSSLQFHPPPYAAASVPTHSSSQPPAFSFPLSQPTSLHTQSQKYSFSFQPPPAPQSNVFSFPAPFSFDNKHSQPFSFSAQPSTVHPASSTSSSSPTTIPPFPRFGDEEEEAQRGEYDDRSVQTFNTAHTLGSEFRACL